MENNIITRTKSPLTISSRFFFAFFGDHPIGTPVMLVLKSRCTDFTGLDLPKTIFPKRQWEIWHLDCDLGCLGAHI